MRYSATVLCGGLLVAGALAIFVWGISGGRGADWGRNAEVLAERAVRDRFQNPNSAQFKNTVAHKVGRDDERWVCGWVNAKDTSGGFFGFRRFVVHLVRTGDPVSGVGSTVSTYPLLSDADVPSMSFAWDHYCR
jgi:hypothetical protein